MPANTRPNIVFVLSDQQRWDTLGCYGQGMPITPNLDRMAAEGVRFRNTFTPQPVCGPARACLQTGQYATEVGCFRNGIALPGNARTLAHWLGEAGYEVGYIGKWHLADTGQTDPVPPEQRGGYGDHWLVSNMLEMTSHGYDGYLFDADMRRVDFKGYRVDCLTDFALEHLRGRTRDRPFFLFLSYLEPHHQNDRQCYEGPTGSRERFADFDVPGDLVGVDGDWPQQFPDYLGCCASLDANLGRVRAELERLGLADNTLLIYTSDHGCHFRTRNSEYKRSCHEASIRVPLIAVGPGFRGGDVIDPLVSLLDLPPTILAACGVQAPPAMRGRQLQTLVNGPCDDWRGNVFIQISESQVGRAIRTARWKYAVSAPSDDPDLGWNLAASDSYREECLYDLQNDLHERDNLVRDPRHVELRRQLARTLQRHMASAGEESARILPAET